MRKLLTAIARNNRLFEGAWMGLFEDGFAVQLFIRLLELEEALTAEPESIWRRGRMSAPREIEFRWPNIEMRIESCLVCAE